MKTLMLLFFISIPVMHAQGDEPVVKLKYKVATYSRPGGVSNVTDFNEIEITVKGTVYLNADFELGKVFLGGKQLEEIPMRYNAYDDYIEISKNGQKPVAMMKNRDVEAFVDGKTYRYINYQVGNQEKQGYFTPLNKGQTELYSRTRKIVPKFDFPENGYDNFEPPSFVTQKSYFIKRIDRPAVELLNLGRKEVFAVLWDHFSELRKYAKEQHLKMRSEEEVIQVLKYYDTLNTNAPQPQEDTNEKI